MTKSVQLRSLAKVNLDLRVLHKREDGYHELRTVFQTISLADSIKIDFAPAKKTSLAIDDQHNIPNNLILQAAASVLDTMKVHAQIRFRLRKQIPMGAGLGGGSSNAASVLLALPVLAGTALPLEKLIEIGSSLGSDVPFFLEGGTTMAMGRGTEMYSLQDVMQAPILLLAPGIHVSTVEAYQKLGLPAAEKLTSMALSLKMNEFQRYVRALLETRSAKAASTLSANDFEFSVFNLHSGIQRLFKMLRKIAPATRMTGSGSALFAVFDSVAERDAACAQLGRAKTLQTSESPAQWLKASLVSRAGYRRMWRRQLAQHIVQDNLLWPPRSRYAR